jgi:hypothetical protein
MALESENSVNGRHLERSRFLPVVMKTATRSCSYQHLKGSR